MPKLYFRPDAIFCHTKAVLLEDMRFEGITELEVYEAEKERGSGYFFCRHFVEVGEKSESGCGRLCKAYAPKNGRSGMCRHQGATYERTDRKEILRIKN